MNKIFLTALLILSTIVPLAQQSEVPLIPMKDFFRNAEKRSYQISPDGDYLIIYAAG